MVRVLRFHIDDRKLVVGQFYKRGTTAITEPSAVAPDATGHLNNNAGGITLYILKKPQASGATALGSANQCQR